ncbi:MAG: CHAD domain-containing protein [Burkholderiales bacterium]|nr:CHAD domain-containing protein [Burkholderiales bacterium]
MSATVELVLAIEATAASEWMTGAGSAVDERSGVSRAGRAHSGKRTPAKARRASTSTSTSTSTSVAGRTADVQAKLGATIADAMNRMPGMTEMPAIEPSITRVFLERNGTGRVMLSLDSGGAPHIAVAHSSELSPGVRRCEMVREAAFEADSALQFGDGLPPIAKDIASKRDDLTPSPVLSIRRAAWRWSGPDGALVDIELRDARAAAAPGEAETSAETTVSSTEPPPLSSHDRPEAIAFCELRLASPIVGPQVAPMAVDGGALSVVADLQLDDPDAQPGGLDTPNASNTTAAGFAQPGTRHDSTVAALQAVFAAAGALADTLPVFPTLVDGCARACICAESCAPTPARAARIDLSKARSPHDAFVEVGSSIARHWFGNDLGVRERADVEFVHQMRVALRRLKTSMKTFPRWVDATWERTIAPDLDWLSALLGQVRDLDVFTGSTLPALAAADVETGAWASLQTRAEARRDDARAQLQKALLTRRYAAFSLAWLKWLAMQHFTPGPEALTDKPLAAYAAKRVRKHYRRLTAKPELSALGAAERHRRRIEAKRLRYTLEFFESVSTRKTRRQVSKQLSRIQSVLGDGSDAIAALRFLEALDVPPYQHGFARGWCEAVNRWSAVEGERLLRELRKPKIVR